MNQLNDQQLNTRIDAFLARKHQQYPELALREEEKHVESIGDVVVDKLQSLMATRNIRRFA